MHCEVLEVFEVCFGLVLCFAFVGFVVLVILVAVVILLGTRWSTTL